MEQDRIMTSYHGVRISLATKLAIKSAEHAEQLRDIIELFDAGNITEHELLSKMASEAYKFLDYVATEQRSYHDAMEEI